MNFIPLNNSDRLCLIDDVDYQEVLTLNTDWKIKYNKDKKTGYVMSTKGFKGNRQIILHRFLLGLKRKDKVEVDHKNGNTCDNRRNNLRIATVSQNNSNRLCKNKSSVYKGVYWYEPLKKWKAQITSNKISKHLGYFSIEIDAARAYNNAAIKCFGEFAKLNQV